MKKPNQLSQPNEPVEKNTQTQKDSELASEVVGYKKPPKQHRFVKGQSGNPSGRPKGKRSWAKLWQEAFDEPTTIEDNGRIRIVTKLQASFIHAANKASKGSAPAIRLAMNRAPIVDSALNIQSVAMLSDAQDQAILAQLYAELKQGEVQVISAKESEDAPVQTVTLKDGEE